MYIHVYCFCILVVINVALHETPDHCMPLDDKKYMYYR